MRVGGRLPVVGRTEPTVTIDDGILLGRSETLGVVRIGGTVVQKTPGAARSDARARRPGHVGSGP